MSTYPQQGPVDPVGNRDVVHKSTGQHAAWTRGVPWRRQTDRVLGRRARHGARVAGRLFSAQPEQLLGAAEMRARILQDRESENHA
jgi:hypothetical protein